MFRRTIAFATFFLVVLALGLAWGIGRVYKKDIEQYREIMSSIDSTTLDEQQRSYVAKQQRKGTQKQFIFCKDEQHLQLLVDSERSSIILDRHQDSTEIVEHLEKVKGYMQEELYYALSDGREFVKKSNGRLTSRNGNAGAELSFTDDMLNALVPMQSMRYFEADRASYHYKSNRLVLDNVQMKSYDIPGHKMTTSLSKYVPNMSGKGASAEVFLDGDEILFKVHGLKAIKATIPLGKG